MSARANNTGFKSKPKDQLGSKDKPRVKKIGKRKIPIKKAKKGIRAKDAPRPSIRVRRTKRRPERRPLVGRIKVSKKKAVGVSPGRVIELVGPGTRRRDETPRLPFIEGSGFRSRGPPPPKFRNIGVPLNELRKITKEQIRRALEAPLKAKFRSNVSQRKGFSQGITEPTFRAIFPTLIDQNSAFMSIRADFDPDAIGPPGSRNPFDIPEDRWSDVEHILSDTLAKRSAELQAEEAQSTGPAASTNSELMLLAKLLGGDVVAALGGPRGPPPGGDDDDEKRPPDVPQAVEGVDLPDRSNDVTNQERLIQPVADPVAIITPANETQPEDEALDPLIRLRQRQDPLHVRRPDRVVIQQRPGMPPIVTVVAGESDTRRTPMDHGPEIAPAARHRPLQRDPPPAIVNLVERPSRVPLGERGAHVGHEVRREHGPDVVQERVHEQIGRAQRSPVELGEEKFMNPEDPEEVEAIVAEDPRLRLEQPLPADARPLGSREKLPSKLEESTSREEQKEQEALIRIEKALGAEGEIEETIRSLEEEINKALAEEAVILSAAKKIPSLRTIEKNLRKKLPDIPTDQIKELVKTTSKIAKKAKKEKKKREKLNLPPQIEKSVAESEAESSVATEEFDKFLESLGPLVDVPAKTAPQLRLEDILLGGVRKLTRFIGKENTTRLNIDIKEGKQLFTPEIDEILDVVISKSRKKKITKAESLAVVNLIDPRADITGAEKRKRAQAVASLLMARAGFTKQQRLDAIRKAATGLRFKPPLPRRLRRGERADVGGRLDIIAQKARSMTPRQHLISIHGGSFAGGTFQGSLGQSNRAALGVPVGGAMGVSGSRQMNGVFRQMSLNHPLKGLKAAKPDLTKPFDLLGYLTAPPHKRPHSIIPRKGTINSTVRTRRIMRPAGGQIKLTKSEKEAIESIRKEKAFQLTPAEEAAVLSKRRGDFGIKNFRPALRKSTARERPQKVEIVPPPTAAVKARRRKATAAFGVKRISKRRKAVAKRKDFPFKKKVELEGIKAQFRKDVERLRRIRKRESFEDVLDQYEKERDEVADRIRSIFIREGVDIKTSKAGKMMQIFLNQQNARIERLR